MTEAPAAPPGLPQYVAVTAQSAEVLCPRCKALMFWDITMHMHRVVYRHYGCPRGCCYLGIPFSRDELTVYREVRDQETQVERDERARPWWRRLFPRSAAPP